jgi:hypothetical protein
MKYRVSPGTGTFQARRTCVMALDMAMVGRPTGWENTTHATLALPAADTLQGFVIQDDWSILASQGVGGVFQSGNMSAVIDRRWGTACFYHHDTKTVVLRALADVETQTDRPLGNAGPLVNRSPRGRLTLRQDWAI